MPNVPRQIVFFKVVGQEKWMLPKLAFSDSEK